MDLCPTARRNMVGLSTTAGRSQVGRGQVGGVCLWRDRPDERAWHPTRPLLVLTRGLMEIHLVAGGRAEVG